MQKHLVRTGFAQASENETFSSCDAVAAKTEVQFGRREKGSAASQQRGSEQKYSDGRGFDRRERYIYPRPSLRALRLALLPLLLRLGGSERP